MDIRNWPMDKIMQLPDHIFGRRFVVSCMLKLTTGQRLWDIAEIPFPENCVIWEVGIMGNGTISEQLRVRMALGDQLPTTVEEMSLLTPLIMGYGEQGADPRQFDVYWGHVSRMSRMRVPLAAAGRRLVIEAESSEVVGGKVIVAVTVSSIPTEVPDWLS